MPRFYEALLRQVVFLYPTREAALRQQRLGGVGFIVCRPFAPVPDSYFPYLISNRHVVWNAGCSVLRLNRCDGTADIIETDPLEWVLHPGNEDLAALPALFYIRGLYGLGFSDMAEFVTPELIQKTEIGIGDEVFMVGRSMTHQGSVLHTPTLLFGCIKAIPEGMAKPSLSVKTKGFVVAMRSSDGLSGSPVRAYNNNKMAVDGQCHHHHLLGVNRGYVLGNPPSMVSENKGISGVIPAWHITELLNTQGLRNVQESHERRFSGAEWW